MKCCQEENHDTCKHTVHLILLILGIAVTVAFVVYGFAVKRRRFLHEEKWKDYDECGMS